MKTTFKIESAYESALQAADLADFDAMMQAKGGPPTSKHRHRETIPIQIPIDGHPGRFFLKRVFKVPPKHAFWPLFRGRLGQSQPCEEWHVLIELEKAGIPAMRRVAFGERRSRGMPIQAFLLVEHVPMLHTLENWLVPGFPKPAPISKRLRDRLLYETGLLVRRLCDAGFQWPDIHAKHIYAAPRTERTAEALWDFCLIDVERMTKTGKDAEVPQVSSPMDRPGLQRALRKLQNSLRPMQFDRWDATRLLAGACLQDVADLRHRRLDRADITMMVRAFTTCNGLRLPDDYEHPRCIPLKKLGKMILDERMVAWFQAVGLNSFDDVFHYAAGTDLRKPGLGSYRDRVRMESAGKDGQTKAFYLKRYRRPPLKEQFRRIWECGLSSSGWREMHAIKTLQELGIPTLRGVAFGQKMRGILERKSFGITEEVEGVSLEEFTDKALDDPKAVPSWRERREIIMQLAWLARELHRNQLYHRDLYLCHVFLTRNIDGQIVLRLIDLARLLKRPRRPRRWRIKDLAALEYSAPSPLVTRADRIRFLYHYQDQAQRRGAIDRRLIKSIQARVRRIARHDKRRRNLLAREAKA